MQILRDFSTQLPKAAAPRRLALEIAKGTLIDNYTPCHLLNLLTNRSYYR